MRLSLLTLATLFLTPAASPQDRIQSWPIWQKYQKDSADQAGLIKSANTQARWIDATHLGYKKGGDWFVVELPSGKETKVAEEPKAADSSFGRSPADGRRSPGRGGQYDEAFSGDGKWKATYRDANVWIQKENAEPKAVTTDGSVAKKVKYGKGSWVYGEELSQSEAMGLNADGSYLWYYRFDETPVIDNFVVFRQNTAHPFFEQQAYPKPGNDNPVVDLFVYNTATGKSTPVKVRPGAFDTGVGHYVYDIHWSPISKELYFRRTDRKQKTMEFCAADPESGSVRVIVKEEWPKSYAENKLGVWYLESMKGGDKYKGKILWESQRNGFLNLYIVDVATGAAKAVTQNQFDETRVVRVDPNLGKVFYMGRGAGNPYFDQLYAVNLDGTGNTRATDPDFDHNAFLSPDGRWAVDTAERCDTPPVVSLIDMKGTVIRELAKADVSAFLAAGYSLPERIVYTSADGKTKIHGVVRKPRYFDPTKKYPLIVDVYGGPLDPHSSGFSESFRAFDGQTGLGVLKATFDNRGTGGRGKVFSDPLYNNMGIVEMDDQAEGVKAIIAKGYVDTDRVGMTGTSYGGYSSVMCILRHPDVFKAAVACSAVTAWTNYDTIYTERYMGLTDENKDGYKAGSAMTYADKLKGWLMIYYGTSDENVHPCNSLQLISKLQQLGKSIEVQIGTDQGHTAVDWRRGMEFFFERLDIPRQ